jgi:plastocyanin
MSGRRITRCGLGLAALLGVAATATATTVAGHVDLITKGGQHATDMSDVVVYVEGVDVRPKPPKTVSATITMQRKQFSPRVVVIPVGGSVEFPNTDPIFHNVFSVSGENRFDLELYKSPKSGINTFQHAGIVRVYCNIHPQMSAAIVVRDNPFFTKATQDGSFSIDGVPPGRYTLTAWHERAPNGVSSELIVPATGRIEGQLTLDASAFKQAPHKNKFGKDYTAPSDDKY